MKLIDSIVMLFIPPSKHHLYAMMKAIDHARKDFSDTKKPYSKTDGLRVIRRFEKVNKIFFNPFKNSHLACIEACGEYENFFRRSGAVFASYENRKNN